MKDEISVRAVSRRALFCGAIAAGGFFLLGCSQQKGGGSTASAVQDGSPSVGAQKASMTVYRDPSCGCCESWAKIAEDAGYATTVLEEGDMAAVKARLGVPEELASCHTATVDDLVIEGHVPMDDVARLLASRGDIIGLAVPGMPAGSPGMEMPDGTRQPYQVIAFRAGGETSVFSSQNS